MRLSLLLAALTLIPLTTAAAIEPILATAIATPTMRSGTYHPASTLVGGGAFYGDFAIRLQTLQNQRQLAQAELDVIDRRVDSFRPFRSFGPYGATYFVDQQWQLEQLAAQQRLACLDAEEAALWRQRRVVGAAIMNGPSR